MKTKLLALILVSGAAALSAQTAKVIQLSPEDAKEALNLYTQQAEIEKRISALEAKITNGYLYAMVQWPSSGCATFDGTPCKPPTPTPEDKAAATHLERKLGWEWGFVFSEDYRFIVPISLPPVTFYPNQTILGCPTSLTVAPASATAFTSVPINTFQ